MDSGKIAPSQFAKRTSLAFQKRKTVTPTPRRNSFQHTERKRQSVFSNYAQQPQKNLISTTRPKSQDFLVCRNTKSSSIVKKKIQIKNDLFVKGNFVPNSHKKKSKNSLLEKDKFKIQTHQYQNKFNKKKHHIKKNIHPQNDTILSTIETDQKLQLKQQKLITKLFKGIEFHRDLGKGAHALVKSAVDWNHNRKVAVKIYSRSLLKDEDIKIFSVNLDHENIVKLYQIIESYKTINLLMEYGGGNSLDQFIRSKNSGRLKEEEACTIFTQVLKASAYLEKMNVAHRDLKPENILLNKHLDVKIIDFGFSLTCLLDKQINSYCGTPTYMAPELVSKIPHSPHLSDRWSLGILLYTMLNGCCPFKAPTQKQLFEKIINGEFWYLSNVSEEAKQLISLFLNKNPQQRISPQKALESKWTLKNLNDNNLTNQLNR